MRGHFFETVLLLHDSGVMPGASTSTRLLGVRAALASLAFGEPDYVCPPRKIFLSFYSLLFPSGGHITFDPGCRAALERQNIGSTNLVLNFTSNAQWKNRHYWEARWDLFDWPSYFRNCRIVHGVVREWALHWPGLHAVGTKNTCA